MSAEQSRLRSAIQRIAKEGPELRGAIDAAKSRGDQPGGTGVGESDGERDRICCDGSTSDNTNPGTEERDTSDGGQDGLDPNDPANLESGPGELTGVVDCATGEPVCFDGGELIPPEGWEDAATPPIDPEYEDGVYYRASVPIDGCGGTEYFQTCTPARVYVAEKMTLCGFQTDPSGVPCPATSGGNYRIDKLFCSSAPNILCDLPPPAADSWPSDGCVNLAIVNGSIVGSKYDPENDGSYSAPRDEIELCDEDGNSILIRPSADGGWKSIESLDGDIDPETGNGYLYAPDGKRIRQISPSEFRDDMV